jgi:DNA-binding response OmpR family regulator
MARPLVLLVEDDLTVRRPLEKFLAMHEFDVVAAATAAQAKSLAASRMPAAAIVDLRLPEGTGREVIEALPPAVAVIIFSGVPGESGGIEQSRPRTRLVTKPFSLLMVIEMLQEMLADATKS